LVTDFCNYIIMVPGFFLASWLGLLFLGLTIKAMNEWMNEWMDGWMDE
jgi:hypothetical protein